MRPAFSFRIKDAIAVDDFVAFVLKHWEVKIAGKSLFQLLYVFFAVLVAVDADRQDLHLFFLFFRQKIFQLAELFGAVGSPVASIEYQHKGLLAANGGK